MRLALLALLAALTLAAPASAQRPALRAYVGGTVSNSTGDGFGPLGPSAAFSVGTRGSGAQAELSLSSRTRTLHFPSPPQGPPVFEESTDRQADVMLSVAGRLELEAGGFQPVVYAGPFLDFMLEGGGADSPIVGALAGIGVWHPVRERLALGLDFRVRQDFQETFGRGTVRQTILEARLGAEF